QQIACCVEGDCLWADFGINGRTALTAEEAGTIRFPISVNSDPLARYGVNDTGACINAPDSALGASANQNVSGRIDGCIFDRNPGFGCGPSGPAESEFCSAGNPGDLPAGDVHTPDPGKTEQQKITRRIKGDLCWRVEIPDQVVGRIDEVE